MIIQMIIHQFNTNYPYEMGVYFDENSEKWVLRFNCLQKNVSHEESHYYDTRDEALRHFKSNCKYYNVHVPQNLLP